MTDIEKRLAAEVLRYRKTLLSRVIGKIYSLFSDSPVDDQTDEEAGYERGLSAAIKAIINMKEQ